MRACSASSRTGGSGRLPIHNNISELNLRRQAVGRKNWLFVGSDDGAQVNAVFTSLLAGCRMLDEPEIVSGDDIVPGEGATLWAGSRSGPVYRIDGEHIETLPEPPDPLDPSRAASEVTDGTDRPRERGEGDEGWRELARRGDHEGAHRLLGSARVERIARTTSSPQELFLVADVAREAGTPSKALTPLRRILREDPDDPRTRSRWPSGASWPSRPAGSPRAGGIGVPARRRAGVAQGPRGHRGERELLVLPERVLELSVHPLDHGCVVAGLLSFALVARLHDGEHRNQGDPMRMVVTRASANLLSRLAYAWLPLFEQE